jgi:hypothetical protein
VKTELFEVPAKEEVTVTFWFWFPAAPGEKTLSPTNAKLWSTWLTPWKPSVE